MKRTNQQRPPAKTRYRVCHHEEAGLFDTMTGATLWALKNLKDWKWKIEPVAASPIKLGIETPLGQNPPSEC